jgi:hypothetical protein
MRHTCACWRVPAGRRRFLQFHVFYKLFQELQMNNRLHRTIGMLLMCVLAAGIFAVPAFAQGVHGSVAGVVKDPSGAAIVGATVSLINNGTNEVKTTTSSGEGSFVFNLINNGSYTVTVEKEAFVTANYKDVIVLPAQQYSLVATLKVGAKGETVEVTAGQDIVNTTSSELTGTVNQQQMLNLPLNGRNPIELLRTQAGVPGILAASREQTAINGGRPGWTQVTQDGINVQDNFIRNNATDFLPATPTSDSIGEFTVITNNVGADSSGGATQVRLVTPTGGNQFHGTVYEYNRNSALGAYNFMTKRVTPTPKKPFLNLNQFGGNFSGPIIKNKLFFWGFYEGFRQRQQTLQSNIVPVNADYLTGMYRYSPSSGGAVQSVNVLNMINANIAALKAAGKTTLSPLTINQTIQQLYLAKVRQAGTGNSLACGDSTAAVSRNTTCYQFNQGVPWDKNQVSFRTDYNLSAHHSLQFNFQRFTDAAGRSDADSVNATPVATLSTNNKLFVGAWRWTITDHLLNEFRTGDYSSVVPFLRGQPIPAFFTDPASNTAPTVTGLGLTAPASQFMDQGRDVTTRQYIDNATWTHGSHNVTFGMSYQGVKPHPYNYASTIPTVLFGFGGSTPFSPYNLTVSTNPGGNFAAGAAPTQTQVNAMNNYAAFLTGAITQLSQTFQVKDLESGFVNGYPNKRAFDYSFTNFYVQDAWRMRPNLTITAGLKYEYWSPISEEHSLAMLPVIPDGQEFKAAMLSGSLSVKPFKQLWKPDTNQFAPNFGVAWDPFGKGKTSVRAGYSLAFVNEDSVTAAQNALQNFGMTGAVQQINLAQFLSGPPTIAVPPLNVNRVFADQTRDGGITSPAYGIDPHLRTPYTHELSFGVSQEVGWNSAVEARYVGNFGRDLWKGVDYNQQLAGVGNDPFLNDFNRARSNLFLCGNPVAPASCTGGQVLTYFPTLDLGGNLSNPTIQGLIRQGQIGSLADTYVKSPALYPNAWKTFVPNPAIYALDGLVNGSSLNYNALQVEFRRRNVHGFAFQANYTYSKDLSDSYGDSQSRLEPLVDNARPHLAYGRSPFDINHIINTNYVYEFPFGKGKTFLNGANGLVDRLVGGWSMSNILKWQSGAPFSIMSQYATISRRNTYVTAFSTLNRHQIQDLIHIKTVNGTTYWIDPKVLNTNGTAVGADGLSYTPAFSGQVFFNPQPGQVGNIALNQFSGPSVMSWDASIIKRVMITERIKTEFHFDAFNVANTANFYVGDPITTGFGTVNSSTFGQTSSRGLANRVVQMSLRLMF